MLIIITQMSLIKMMFDSKSTARTRRSLTILSMGLVFIILLLVVSSEAALFGNIYKWYYWKCNFPITPYVSLLVGGLVFRSADSLYVIIFWKGVSRQVTLPCSFWSTCCFTESWIKEREWPNDQYYNKMKRSLLDAGESLLHFLVRLNRCRPFVLILSHKHKI